jgi:hypothetical protein
LPEKVVPILSVAMFNVSLCGHALLDDGKIAIACSLTLEPIMNQGWRGRFTYRPFLYIGLEVQVASLFGQSVISLAHDEP